MAEALVEARKAAGEGEVPIGSVVVFEGRIVGRGRNARERLRDPTAHAEILALRAAAERAGRWHLDGGTIYVTLEPCAMCAGAMVLARVRRLVFGTADPKAGFAGSLGNIVEHARLNHRIAVTDGVGASESAGLLRDFFARRRVERRARTEDDVPPGRT